VSAEPRRDRQQQQPSPFQNVDVKTSSSTYNTLSNDFLEQIRGVGGGGVYKGRGEGLTGDMRWEGGGRPGRVGSADGGDRRNRDLPQSSNLSQIRRTLSDQSGAGGAGAPEVIKRNRFGSLDLPRYPA